MCPLTQSTPNPITELKCLPFTCVHNRVVEVGVYLVAISVLAADPDYRAPQFYHKQVSNGKHGLNTGTLLDGNPRKCSDRSGSTDEILEL